MRWRQTAKAKLLTELPQAHVLTVLTQGNDMFLGTAGKGAVYELGADGSLAALVDTNGDDVTILTDGSNGMLYAGTSNGKVYRLARSAAPEIFDEKTPIAGCTGCYGPGQTHWRLGWWPEEARSHHPDKQHDIIEDTETTHLLCLAARPGNTVCVGSAAPESSGKLTLEGRHRELRIFHTRQALRRNGGRSSWLASVPTGTELTVRTRSSSSANPRITFR